MLLVQRLMQHRSGLSRLDINLGESASQTKEALDLTMHLHRYLVSLYGHAVLMPC